MEWLDSTMLALLLPTVLMCIIASLIVMRTRARDRYRKLPPGPKGLPIIGHLHLLGKLPHRSLYELSKVHGPLMWLRLGNVSSVVASSPEMARQILQTHDSEFANRMPTAASAEILGAGYPDITFSPPDGLWKLMRRVCIAELFSTKPLDLFKSGRDEEVRLLTRSVLADSIDPTKSYSNDAKPVQCLRRKLKETTNDIISRMLLGRRLSELDGMEDLGDFNASKIVDVLEELPKCVGMFNVGDYLPFIAWMDLQGCVRRSKRAGAAFRVAFEGLIQARRLSYRDQEPPPAKDFLDLLLQVCTHTPFDIVNICLDMFAAGTETSSLAIEWALAELLLNPDKMRAVQAEIDEVVGKERIVEESDLAHLPYLTACVKETMRLHPLLTLLVPHMTKDACEVSGFHIPANTVAYVNVWAIGRDSKFWESPSEFLPERFLCSSVGMQGQHFELLPFGSGRRVCPGWRLGLLNVQNILARLLQGFEWTIPHSHQLNMAESYGLVTSLTTPLVAFTTPRLPTELY